MLNNTAREFLLQANRGNTAICIDGLYFAGWSAGEVFTFQQAYEYLSFFGASKKLVRAGLNDPLFKRVGRRSARYTLPSPQDVLSALNLQESPFMDVLEGSAFANLAAYRKALYVGFLARNEGSYSRQLLSSRLGVSRITTLNYEKFINAAGLDYKIYVEPQFQRLKITEKNVKYLPLTAPKEYKREWLEGHGAPNVKEIKTPLIQVCARKLLSKGLTVYQTTQLTNYYQIVPA